MDSLARSLLCTFAFLELSDDETIDPDAAVSAMESMTAVLRSCTDEEKAALKKAIEAELDLRNSRDADETELEFYRNLMVNLGLEDED